MRNSGECAYEARSRCWCNCGGCSAVHGCFSTGAKEHSATALLQAIEANPERSVSLGSAYGESATFDRAVRLCPSMSAEGVEQALGFTWTRASRVALKDESKSNILLVQGDRVNAIVSLVRTEIDSCTAPAESLTVISP